MNGTETEGRETSSESEYRDEEGALAKEKWLDIGEVRINTRQANQTVIDRIWDF